MNKLFSSLEYIDLSPVITARRVEEMVHETKAHGFAGLCLPPFWIKKARRELGISHALLLTVVGYPYGYQMTQTKVAEIQQALHDGATELLVALNLSAFKSGMPWVKIEIAKCATLAHEREALLTIALDSAYLNASEITELATLSADAGADGLQLVAEDVAWDTLLAQVRLLRDVLPTSVTVKVRREVDGLQAVALREAGAERIATANAVRLVSDEKTTP
ncbi:MAG: 2-deoxyribose-5-phosphate aldolase [Tunicatimonas sp.]